MYFDIFKVSHHQKKLALLMEKHAERESTERNISRPNTLKRSLQAYKDFNAVLDLKFRNPEAAHTNSRIANVALSVTVMGVSE